MKVAVIGLGTVGSMTMWQLVKQGVDVAGFEQFGIGHDYAAAGGESRLFRTAYGEGASYTPLMLASAELWRELEAETNQSLLSLYGGLMIGDPDSAFMRNVQESAEKFNLQVKVYNETEAKEKYPQHKLLAGEIMLKDYAAGYLRPELAVVSAVKQAEKYGAKVHAYAKVEKIEDDGEQVLLFVGGKEYTFDKVIVTTGPWTGSFLPEFHKEIAVKRLAMGWFPAKDISKFQKENYPIVMRESGEDKFYSTPTLEGTMVKVAIYANYGILQDADQLDRTILPNDIAKLRAVVENYLPDLYPDPCRVSVYMDGFTPDEHALIGQMPDKQNIIISSGFSGHGFKLAPIFGQITADLTLGKKIDKQFQIEQFAPSRFFEKSVEETDK